MSDPSQLQQTNSVHITFFFIETDIFLLLVYFSRIPISSTNLFCCSYKHKQPGSFRACNVKFRSKHIKLTF
jgi:hypothetical protein